TAVGQGSFAGPALEESRFPPHQPAWQCLVAMMFHMQKQPVVVLVAPKRMARSFSRSEVTGCTLRSLVMARTLRAESDKPPHRVYLVMEPGSEIRDHAAEAAEDLGAPRPEEVGVDQHDASQYGRWQAGQDGCGEAGHVSVDRWRKP